MLRISDHELKQESKDKGYRPEMIEKVYHLLELLDYGGTAINLFCTEQFSRLSVDLDLNYIVSIDKDAMQQVVLNKKEKSNDSFKKNADPRYG